MEKHLTISLVYLCSSFVLQPFPVCFTTEQSTVKASSFVKLKAISVIAGLCTEYCNSQSRNISDQLNGKYLIKIIFILKFQLKSDFRISSETQGQIVGARESLNKRYKWRKER